VQTARRGKDGLGLSRFEHSIYGGKDLEDLRKPQSPGFLQNDDGRYSVPAVFEMV
jgi:hypothetical protein